MSNNLPSDFANCASVLLLFMVAVLFFSFQVLQSTTRMCQDCVEALKEVMVATKGCGRHELNEFDELNEFNEQDVAGQAKIKDSQKRTESKNVY